MALTQPGDEASLSQMRRFCPIHLKPNAPAPFSCRITSLQKGKRDACEWSCREGGRSWLLCKARLGNVMRTWPWLCYPSRIQHIQHVLAAKGHPPSPCQPRTRTACCLPSGYGDLARSRSKPHLGPAARSHSAVRTCDGSPVAPARPAGELTSRQGTCPTRRSVPRAVTAAAAVAETPGPPSPAQRDFYHGPEEARAALGSRHGEEAASAKHGMWRCIFSDQD